jgi:hypothetical protein
MPNGYVQELGLEEAAAELVSSKPAPKQRKKKEKSAEPQEASRRSERPRKEVSYCEMERVVSREKAPVDYTERIKVGWDGPFNMYRLRALLRLS